MTSAVLQCLAVVTMLIDHMGYRLFPGMEWLRVVGRLAFPIFAFMLVEGFVHTSNRKKYLLRLGIFALVSEIPYRIFTYGFYGWPTVLSFSWGNIFFELLIIFGALWCLEEGKAKNKLFYIGAAGLAVLAEVLGTMYGAYGVLMAAAFYIFRERRWAGMVCLAVLSVLYCMHQGYWMQIFAVAAVVPLYLYNGERGQRLPRYFCYGFYPVHLLAIYGLYLLMPPMIY